MLYEFTDMEDYLKQIQNNPWEDTMQKDSSANIERDLIEKGTPYTPVPEEIQAYLSDSEVTTTSELDDEQNTYVMETIKKASDSINLNTPNEFVKGALGPLDVKIKESSLLTTIGSGIAKKLAIGAAKEFVPNLLGNVAQEMGTLKALEKLTTNTNPIHQSVLSQEINDILSISGKKNVKDLTKLKDVEDLAKKYSVKPDQMASIISQHPKRFRTAKNIGDFAVDQMSKIPGMYQEYKLGENRALLLSELPPDSTLHKAYKLTNDVTTLGMTPGQPYYQTVQALEKHPWEVESLKAQTMKSNLESQKLQKDLQRRSTLIGSLGDTSIGQLFGPIMTGALITGGGIAGLKALNTLGVIGGMAGIQDPATTAVVNMAVNKIYQVKPSLRDINPSLVKKYYSLIYKVAPSVASDSMTSANLIERMLNYGGPDYQIIKDLASTEKQMNERQNQTIDLFSMGQNSMIRY